MTPLLVAVKQKDINTVRALIDWNCRLDIVGRCRVRRDDYEFDPFELAINQGLWDIVNLLIIAGYNVSKLSYVHEIDSMINVPQSLKGNPGMFDLLVEIASSPPTLMKSSILVVYKAIKSNIMNKIDSLPLPPTIKDYLKF